MEKICEYCDDEVAVPNRSTCYAHCPDEESGQHVADMSTGHVYDGSSHDDEAIVDFNCMYCGQSTGHRVLAADLVWS